jgi:hypothetical protein
MKRYAVLASLILFALAASVAPALAQVQFNVAGGNVIVRGEGHTESVSSVSLTAAAAGTIPSGTTINFDFSATVTNSPSATNLTCAGTIAGAGGACPGGWTAVPSGNRVTVTIIPTAPAVNQAIAAGDSIILGKVRVDVAGSGLASVTVQLSSTPASSNVTYNPTQVPVALVVSPSVAITITAAAAGVLTCAPPTAAGPLATAAAAGPTQAEILVTEKTQRAFTTVAEEMTNTGVTPPIVTNGVWITVTFLGAPNDTTISYDGLRAPSTVTVDVAAGATKKSSGPTKALIFTFKIMSDTPGLDNADFLFSLFSTDGGPLPLGPETVTASVELAPVGPLGSPPSTTSALLFGDFPTTKTAFGVSDCITNLLFPYVTTDPTTTHFDTGIAIANTSSDPFVVGGATPSNGTCTIYGFPTGTATAAEIAAGAMVSYTTAKVDAGAVWAATLGGISALSGLTRAYLIAVCNFQNAHGFAFITNNFGPGSPGPPDLAEGYVALVIPNPSIVSRSPAGGGAGEGLLE